jgi:pimeloyl-ACP methyl ester carboxylesterase
VLAQACAIARSPGHTVLAPDLPGHGEDKTPAAAVTLESYAHAICELSGAQTEPVILVGHSMGGVAITQAAENCPDSVAALVYLCAFLPRNGDSLATWASQDRESMVNPSNNGAADGGERRVQGRLHTRSFLFAM